MTAAKKKAIEDQPEIQNACNDAVEHSGAWAVPQPLTAKIEPYPYPYPVDALPGTVRAAVEEVNGFVQAPVSMVASSAIGAMSLAIQPHVDVKRAEKLDSPVSLSFLTIADSGERKSTCDDFFTKAIRDYESSQAVLAQPFVKEYNAAIESWEAKRRGIKDKIRQLAKESEPTADMESALSDLERDKPKPPLIPHLIYTDVTPEKLAHGLAKQWPSGGVVSAEAGLVFGSHGMGSESIMRNLAQLNQLWDGNSLTIDRRTTESFSVQGARLTVALQVQSATLRIFLDRAGALARGTGFLSRFLIAWPESTQGHRPFTEAPANCPYLAAFNRRITDLLNQPWSCDGEGAPIPQLLSLTPEAKAAWIGYHDAIEGQVASGGYLFDVRDAASKSADNAARLAALFHVFEGGQGDIGAEEIDKACRIAVWHLYESKRFFGELALSVEMSDVTRLDKWLIDYCRREHSHLVGKRYTLQHGPIRNGARLDMAIRDLVSLDRIQLRKEGKQLSLWLNPALLKEGGA
jgi:putative DNA primase/helicase